MNIPQIKLKSVLHIYHQNIFFTIIDCNIFVSEQQVTELQVAEYRIMFQSTHYYHHHMSPVPANCPHLEGQQGTTDHRLYSDRTEHFCGRGAQILTKFFEVVPYMEKMISSPSKPFLVIRVCQKCQKLKKHEKPGF